MKSKTSTRARLTDRDYQILRDAHRFGMVTRESVQAKHLSDNDMDAVQSVLRRLYGHPPKYLYLKPEQLDTKRVYYRLTGRGARALGVTKDTARRLGMTATIQRYALLWYLCVDRPHQRTLFNPRDFPDQFDLLRHRLARQRFYVEEIEPGCMQLGYIIVDHGSDPRRIVRKAGDTMERFIQHGWFDRYIRTGTFGLTLLTVCEEKRLDLNRTLAASLAQRLMLPLRHLGLPVETGLPFAANIVVVPGLTELIPGLR